MEWAKLQRESHQCDSSTDEVHALVTECRNDYCICKAREATERSYLQAFSISDTRNATHSQRGDGGARRRKQRRGKRRRRG